MHATAAMWCMARGKHVSVQKPLVRTIWEARQMREAAAKYKVASQMGNQGYSNEGTRQAAEIIWSGEIGGVKEVHAWSDRPLWPQGLTEIPAGEAVPSTLDWDLWLGVAADRPFTADGKTEPDRWGGFFYQPFNWRGFYDFGCGALGDMACHILGAPNMALHLSKRKVIAVECIKKDGVSPFIGDKGVLTTGTYGEVTRLLPVEKMKDYKLPPALLTRSPGHMRDFIRACKGGDPACSNFDVAAPFVEWMLLGVIALRHEGKLEYDPDKMRITNNAEANKLLKPNFRKGWEFHTVKS